MTVLDRVIPTVTRPPTQVAAESTSMSFSGLESLQKGIIHTDISPKIARWMVVLFIAGLAIVPLSQLLIEIVSPKRHVQELDLFHPPQVDVRAGEGRLHHSARVLKAWVNKEHLAKFEDDLKEESILRHVVQPRMQLAITK